MTLAPKWYTAELGRLPRQTWRVAVDEGRLRVVSDWRPPSFIFHETAFSKRDVIAYS